MKYVDQHLTTSGSERPYATEEYTIRVPQFSSYTEMRKEFSSAQILHIVNETMRFKFTNFARAKAREGIHPQISIWIKEGMGLKEAMFPTRSRSIVIDSEALKKAGSAAEVVEILRKAGAIK